MCYWVWIFRFDCFPYFATQFLSCAPASKHLMVAVNEKVQQSQQNKRSYMHLLKMLLVAQAVDCDMNSQEIFEALLSARKVRDAAVAAILL